MMPCFCFAESGTKNRLHYCGCGNCCVGGHCNTRRNSAHRESLGNHRTFHGDRLYCNLHHSSEQVRQPHTSCILRYFQQCFGHKAGSRRRGGLRCGACAADRHGARSVFKRSGGRLRSDGSCLRKHERSRKAGNVRNFEVLQTR